MCMKTALTYINCMNKSLKRGGGTDSNPLKLTSFPWQNKTPHSTWISDSFVCIQIFSMVHFWSHSTFSWTLYKPSMSAFSHFVAGHWAMGLSWALEKPSTTKTSLPCSWPNLQHLPCIHLVSSALSVLLFSEAHPYPAIVTMRRICFLPVLWLFANHGWDSPLGAFPLLSSFPFSMVSGSESSKCIVINLEQGLACYLMSSWAAWMQFVIRTCLKAIAQTVINVSKMTWLGCR